MDNQQTNQKSNTTETTVKNTPNKCYHHPNLDVAENGAFCKDCYERIIRDVNRAIPPTYRNAKIENLSPELKKYVSDGFYKGRGIYLWGKAGVGKTYALNAIIRDVILYSNRSVEAVSFSEFLQKMQFGFGNQNASNESWKQLGFMKEANVLLLDDVGVEKQSEWAENILFSLLDYRNSHNLITLISSNLKHTALNYSERIISRIVDTMDIFPLEGEDRRRQKH